MNLPIKTLTGISLLFALHVATAPLAVADEGLSVNLGTPPSPPCVCISNARDFSVRLSVTTSWGQRCFLAELKPGEHYSRQLGPPLPSRHWLVTTTSDEVLSTFTLGPGDSGVVVLR